MLHRARNEWGAKIAFQIDFELKNLPPLFKDFYFSLLKLLGVIDCGGKVFKF
jgi:hypothetical protein